MLVEDLYVIFLFLYLFEKMFFDLMFDSIFSDRGKYNQTTNTSTV